MFDFFIRFSLMQRVFVSLLTLLVIGIGIRSWLNLPIDAFPDIAPTQVKVVLKAPGMTTSEIETQVTRVVETELLGIPSQQTLRSTTKYAITDITIDFVAGTDIYWARQQVNERILALFPSLPENVTGGVAPMSTPLSEMFMFTVTNDALSLQQRRELLDWQIRPALRSVAGVADVNSLGGYVKTYEVSPKSQAMQALNVSLAEIEAAIVEHNINGGLGRINKGSDSIVVRTQGKLSELEDLKQLLIRSDSRGSVFLTDVATVNFGHLRRYGAVSKDGEEAVQGLVIALKGANTDAVVAAVKAKLKQLAPSLPKGTHINVFYDRSILIKKAVNTITNALFQAIILVMILLAVFLGNIRAALVVSLSLPLAALATFILMDFFSISANLMSLGGLVIAIGRLVDASVVVVENTVNHLSQQQKLPRLHIIYRAAKEVATPTISGTFIVIIVFAPLLTLQGLEGKLFSPVALTIVFAMIAALIMAFTVIPMLASILLYKEIGAEPKFITRLQSFYYHTLRIAIPKARLLTVIAMTCLGGSLWLFGGLGKSFMPTLDEGDIIVQLEKSPAINLSASTKIDMAIESALLARIPEVLQVVARTGSDELGLDPMSLNETDVFMELKPQDEWRFDSKRRLISEIRTVLNDYPGININFTQPIQMRVSEMLTGGTGDVAIKVFGNDVMQLTKLAAHIEQQVTATTGSKDTQMALVVGGKYLSIKLKPEVAARLGLSVVQLSDYLKPFIEGRVISQVTHANKSTDILLSSSSLPERQQIQSVAELSSLPVLLPNGKLVPLENLAEISVKHEPLLIERENAQRFVAISTNVSGRDVVGFVAELQQRIGEQILIPSGYRIEYGGEFENQQRAMNNLMVVIPVALLLIFVILFSTFRSLRLAVLILANIPFALMGGIFALFITAQYLSIPASIGFIALLGVAVLNGVVMVSYFEQSKSHYTCIQSRVLHGAKRRLRPVLMTATTAMFGLLPLAFAVGPGAEIQKPLAIVVIGGLITSTVTTLYLLPIFYQLVEQSRVRAKYSV